MSRELWAVERCDVCGSNIEHGGVHYRVVDRGTPESWQWKTCGGSGGSRTLLDFDAIWDRYYDIAIRRFATGLTDNELYFVVYGEKKE